MNSVRPSNPAMEARLARRHRAEKRFRFYGRTAIALALGFLCLLIGSILIQAVPAFSAWRLTLPVTLERALVDPAGDASEASLRRGAYNAVIQNALREQFPEIDDRAGLRELYGLYSSLNAARLLNRTADNPETVGETVPFSLPVSHYADLYLKGISVSQSRTEGAAPLQLSVESEQAVLSAGQPVFASFVETVREAAQREARAVEARAERAEMQRDRAVASDERAIYAAEAARARRSAERLRTRLDPEAGLDLGPLLPSLLIKADGAVIRVTRIEPGYARASGELVLAPENAGQEIENWTLWTLETPASVRRISDRQIIMIDALHERGLLRRSFNTELFVNADSREPELAGVAGALIGTLLTMLATMLLAVPVGIGAAIYLEEFAPKNRLTSLIEVNINNLAAVPSIVFGLLGLAVFINLFGLPRSAPLVGGMVLALMTLPTVIIASRAALKAVPPSIREAALGVGASKTQAVFHHVLPLAAPGMLTGSIIGLAQALGETAPLLMIGMVAFIADAPTPGISGMTEPATVMPVQIFLWSSSAERAFEARTAAAIIILLALMISLNALAIYLRRRFERRW